MGVPDCSHWVPVGQDQRQHVEIARDISAAVNNSYRKVLTLSQPLIQEKARAVAEPVLDRQYEIRKVFHIFCNTEPRTMEP